MAILTSDVNQYIHMSYAVIGYNAILLITIFLDSQRSEVYIIGFTHGFTHAKTDR